jgi:hypothetical protein
MSALTFGTAVSNRLTGQIGVIVRSPHGNKSPKGMRWVLFNGSARPVRINATWLSRVEKPAPVTVPSDETARQWPFTGGSR